MAWANGIKTELESSEWQCWENMMARATENEQKRFILTVKFLNVDFSESLFVLSFSVSWRERRKKRRKGILSNWSFSVLCSKHSFSSNSSSLASTLLVYQLDFHYISLLFNFQFSLRLTTIATVIIISSTRRMSIVGLAASKCDSILFFHLHSTSSPLMREKENRKSNIPHRNRNEKWKKKCLKSQNSTISSRIFVSKSPKTFHSPKKEKKNPKFTTTPTLSSSLLRLVFFSPSLLFNGWSRFGGNNRLPNATHAKTGEAK